MPAFLAEPDDAATHPAIVVLIEAFGLVPSIESVARRLAAEGYVALAPDLFYREIPNNTASYDDVPRGIELMNGLVRRGTKFLGDVGAAFSFLEAKANVAPKKLGVTGFCMGGALTFAVACAFPDRVAAAAPFYGGGIVNLLDQAERLASPLYLFFGERDAFIPQIEVRRIEARLRELGKPFQLEVYAGADHGFFNEDRPTVYHPVAARDAWLQLTGFLRDAFATSIGGMPGDRRQGRR